MKLPEIGPNVIQLFYRYDQRFQGAIAAIVLGASFIKIVISTFWESLSFMLAAVGFGFLIALGSFIIRFWLQDYIEERDDINFAHTS